MLFGLEPLMPFVISLSSHNRLIESIKARDSMIDFLTEISFPITITVRSWVRIPLPLGEKMKIKERPKLERITVQAFQQKYTTGTH